MRIRSDKYKERERDKAKTIREKRKLLGLCSSCGLKKENKKLLQCSSCAWKRMINNRQRFNYRPQPQLLKHNYSALELSK